MIIVKRYLKKNNYHLNDEHPTGSEYIKFPAPPSRRGGGYHAWYYCKRGEGIDVLNDIMCNRLRKALSNYTVLASIIIKDVLFTNQPGKMIGKGGEVIKTLSEIAGVKLQVMKAYLYSLPWSKYINTDELEKNALFSFEASSTPTNFPPKYFLFENKLSDSQKEYFLKCVNKND